MDPRQRKRLHLHGTLGAGNSYLLAALACQLRKENYCVVYLPDCYEMLMCEPSAIYILPALYAAFCEDVKLGVRVQALYRTILDQTFDPSRLNWELLVFSNVAAQMKKYILFIVDQANALGDGTDHRVSNDKKGEIRQLLDGLSSRHMKLSSSTANYVAAQHDEFRATSERRVTLCRGLNEVSIEHINRTFGNRN